MEHYFNYRFSNDFEFNASEKEFISVIGNNNELIIHTLLYPNKLCNVFIGDIEFSNKTKRTARRRMGFIIHKHLNIFNAETVLDEIAFGLESLSMSHDDMNELIISESRVYKLDELLERDPNSLGISDKVKLKFLSALILKPKIFVIDNVICELDSNDKELIFNILKEYVKNGGIVLNFTNDMEETLEGEKIIIIHDKQVICEGKTMSVLNEEKILKRLNLGLPFMIELNKYFMDYKMIEKYHMSNEKLVGALWK